MSATLDDLVNSTTALLNAVNVSKATLDAKEATSITKASEAAASAATANTKAGEAAGSASQALAIYGTTAAQQAAVTAATNQANLAAGYATAAASAIQQDISGVTAAALHRAPNAITAMFIYDTSQDSDGGAWTERCQNTSWYNEALNGKWLGAAASEAAARAVSGATTGDYFQLTTDGKFYSLNASSGKTEVFRGNKAKFPKLAAIIAEAASVTIYDLTAPGRPMWMRFVGTATATVSAKTMISGADSVSAVNGVLFVGGNGTDLTGLTIIDFVKGKASWRTTTGYTWNRTIATRNTAGGYTTVDAAVAGIVNATVYSIAATVLPNAPIDPVSNLPVPTIAVLTNGGVSVIRHDGTVSSHALTYSAQDNLSIVKGRLYYSNQNQQGGYKSIRLRDITGSSFAAPRVAQITFSPNKIAVAPDSTAFSPKLDTYGLIYIARANEPSPTKTPVCNITDTYNTGFMAGDIRRCYLSDTGAGSVSNPATVDDRCYKAATATINGTLTKAAVATNAQLMGYSGFSALNYIQGAYSADLDFGTGEWSLSAWALIKDITTNLARYSGDLSNAAWYEQPGTVVSGTGSVPVRTANYTTTPSGNPATRLQFNLNGGTTGTDRSGISQTIDQTFGDIRLMSFWAKTNDGSTVNVLGVVAGSSTSSVVTVTPTWTKFTVKLVANVTNPTSTIRFGLNGAETSQSCDISVGEVQVEKVNNKTDQNNAGIYVPTTTVALSAPTVIAHRGYSSGAYIKIGTNSDADPKLTATAFDGTTTRTVTTASAYNTGQWVKARAAYTTDGTLAISVNGATVATATGAPLLTLNNSNAVLTIGNNYALDAPFPGSLALVKLSASVPTAEQIVWMYEQERALFRDGANCVLPDSGVVQMLSYDDYTDRWLAVSNTNESTWQGLVRVASAVPSSGTFSRCRLKSGIKLLARATTSPGVDVTIPAYGLMEELFKRQEAVAKGRNVATFDFDTIGFTGNLTNGSNSVASVSVTSGTPYVGMGVTGTGIPANTTITAISGATYTLSANATANGTAVAIGQTTFTLPVGYSTGTVRSAGSLKREGATKDYVLAFDGFKETSIFATSPGSGTWVQIEGVRG